MPTLTSADLVGPWRDLVVAAPGLAFVENDESLSRVYHEVKWSLPDGAALAVAPVAGRPKIRGWRTATLAASAHDDRVIAGRHELPDDRVARDLAGDEAGHPRSGRRRAAPARPRRRSRRGGGAPSPGFRRLPPGTQPAAYDARAGSR